MKDNTRKMTGGRMVVMRGGIPRTITVDLYWDWIVCCGHGSWIFSGIEAYDDEQLDWTLTEDEILGAQELYPPHK